MAKKVTIELTETQARTVLVAVEEWFRLRMGQSYDLANDLAFYNYQHDKNRPWDFDLRIQIRDAVNEIIKSIFRVVFGPPGVPREVPSQVHVASDIWSALRYELSPKESGWDRTPFQTGPEPLPKITVEEVE